MIGLKLGMVEYLHVCEPFFLLYIYFKANFIK
jgi:hypothetical protein